MSLLSGTAFLNYKAEQVVLGGLIKRDNFYYKVGQLFYKLGQELQSSGVEEADERNRGNRFWQPTPSFNPNFPGNRHFTPIGMR